MPEPLQPMTPAALQRLRQLIQDVQPAQGNGLDFTEVAALADEVKGVGAVTIDYRAAADLGHPMVVIRPSSAGIEGISAREIEVAGLVAEGLSNKEIASRLGITTGTVKDHVHRILEKTGMPNRAAIAAAIRG
jgi:DNA-binding NarL/FixJ family response regulator